MALPRGVQAQVDEAERLLAGQTEQPPADEAAPPQLDSVPPAAPVAPAVDSVEYWKHKFDVLQGKYNAEVPRFAEQARSQAGEIQSLRQQLNQLSARVQQAQQPQERLVSAEEVNDFTPELLDVVGRRSQEVVAPAISQLQNEIQGLRGELSGVRNVVAMSSADRVRAQLAARFGSENWQAINSDPEFIAWLSLVDPMSQQLRSNMLSSAFAAGNGDSVIAFFEAFQNEHAATHGAAPIPADAGRPSVDLREFTAPGRAAATQVQSGAPTEARIWTPTLVSQFYAAVHKGQYRNKDAERMALEADLFKAQQEGRFR
jgi:hypothetical protein